MLTRRKGKVGVTILK